MVSGVGGGGGVGPIPPNGDNIQQDAQDALNLIQKYEEDPNPKTAQQLKNLANTTTSPVLKQALNDWASGDPDGDEVVKAAANYVLGKGPNPFG